MNGYASQFVHWFLIVHPPTPTALIYGSKGHQPSGKSRKTKKAAADVRLRLYWGVFSQNLKRVAVFEFDQKDEALKRSEELSKGGKAPHFVQKVKEEIKVE